MGDLRKLARGRPCMVRVPNVCTDDRDTTVLAHYRLSGVSGMGMKSPDVCGAWACGDCHEFVDTHRDDATKKWHLEGVIRTLAALVKEELLQW
jgi:hypothetical protein